MTNKESQDRSPTDNTLTDKASPTFLANKNSEESNNLNTDLEKSKDISTTPTESKDLNINPTIEEEANLTASAKASPIEDSELRDNKNTSSSSSLHKTLTKLKGKIQDFKENTYGEPEQLVSEDLHHLIAPLIKEHNLELKTSTPESNQDIEESKEELNQKPELASEASTIESSEQEKDTSVNLTLESSASLPISATLEAETSKLAQEESTLNAKALDKKIEEYSTSSDQTQPLNQASQDSSTTATNDNPSSKPIVAVGQINTSPDYDLLTEFQQQIQKVLPPKIILLTTLILLSVIPGLINTSFSPSIGQIKKEFGSDIVALQSFFLAGMAFGQLIAGPLIDRLGRKPIVIGAGILGIIINIAMTLSIAGWQLYMSRVCQGLVFGALGLCPTIILKDIFSTRQYVIYNSWIVLFFLYAPALGPIWGGYIVIGLGWRWIFYILTTLLIGVLVLFILTIPETAKEQIKTPYSLKAALRNYQRILKNERARYLISLNVGYAICIFSLPVLVPNLFINTYNVHPDHIGYYFLVPLLATLVANRLNVYYIKRGYSPRVIWISASLVQGALTVVNFTVSYFFLGPIGIILTFTVNLFFNGFQLGNLQSLYLQMFPHMTATANSLMSFLRFFIPSIIVYGVSQLPKKDGLTLLHFDGFVVIFCTILTLYYASIYKPYVSHRLDLINKLNNIEKTEANKDKA